VSTATETPNDVQPATDPCPHCGAPVRADQEWCLECGAPARSRVARAPTWRVPAAIIAAIVLLAGAGLAFAFAALSGDSTHVAASLTTPTSASPTTVTAPAVTPTTPVAPSATPTAPPSATTPTTPGTATTPTTPAGPSATSPAPAAPATVGTWPAGRSGYTVVMVSATDRAGARRAAERFARQGIDVGILSSSDFSSLEPGYQVVFSGRYPSLARAQAEAERLQGRGATGAYGRFVKPGP
jgi:SPOR domain